MTDQTMDDRASRSTSPWVTVLAVAVAIGAPSVQAITDWGLGAGEFSRDGQSTLRAAGYAFSIWTLIYAWLCAYAIFRFQAAGSRIDRRLAPAAALTIAGTGAWIVASASDQKLATVFIIVSLASIMAVALLRTERASAARNEWLWIIAPLSLLAGWLTVASAINILTVGTALGVIRPDIATGAAAIGITSVSLVGAVVAGRPGLALFGAAIAWGLSGVVVAEMGDKPMLALLAAGGAAAVLLVAAFGALAGRRRMST